MRVATWAAAAVSVVAFGGVVEAQVPSAPLGTLTAPHHLLAAKQQVEAFQMPCSSVVGVDVFDTNHFKVRCDSGELYAIMVDGIRSNVTPWVSVQHLYQLRIDPEEYEEASARAGGISTSPGSNSTGGVSYDPQIMVEVVRGPCSSVSGHRGFSMEGAQEQMQALGLPLESICADDAQGLTLEQAISKVRILKENESRIRTITIFQNSDYCRILRRNFGRSNSCGWEKEWNLDSEIAAVNYARDYIKNNHGF